MTKKEAEQKAMDARSGMKVSKVTEYEKYFVVSLVPNSFPNGSSYISGATRVDKKTGECRLYNPMLEGMR